MDENLARTISNEVLERRLNRLGVAVGALDSGRPEQPADDVGLRLAGHHLHDNAFVQLHSWRLLQPSGVLELADPESENDVPDTANQGERGDPGDEQNRTPAVIAVSPEAERELDDASDQLQPPDLDLATSGDRSDDVERPGEDEDKADHSSQCFERVAGMDERDDARRDEGDRQDCVEQLPPAASEHRHSELEQAGHQGDNAEE